MKILDQGTVFAPLEESDRPSCTFPSIAVLDDGRWLCAFRSAPHKQDLAGQRALLAWSDDQGRTWSPPADPFVPPTIDGKPGLIRSAGLTDMGGGRVLAVLCWVDHANPDLPFFNERTQGLLDTRVLLAVSADRGRSWSEPRLVNTAPFTAPTPTTGPILRLANGDLACQIELNKRYDEPGPWRHRPVLLFSRDDGRSWPDHAVVAEDPQNNVYYWDQRPTVLSDGRLLNVFWTYDTTRHTYRRIHACVSRDHGRRWSSPRDIGVPGQPAQPVHLADGGLVLVYVDRTSRPAINARLSDDGGRTWPVQTTLTLRESTGQSQRVAGKSVQDAWQEMSDFSIGLPATTALDDGGVLAVFYEGPRTDHTRIRWVRLCR